MARSCRKAGAWRLRDNPRHDFHGHRIAGARAVPVAVEDGAAAGPAARTRAEREALKLEKRLCRQVARPSSTST
jgi:hypothetical protein